MSLTTDIAATTPAVTKNDAPHAMVAAAEKSSHPESKDISEGFQPTTSLSGHPETFGEALEQVHDAFGHAMRTARHNAIDKIPRFIVNNSSNILGASHVATEMLMFKSSIKGAALAPNESNPIKWLYKAMSRVFDDSFAQSIADGAIMKKEMQGKPLSGFFKYVTDTGGATAREVSSQIGEFNLDSATIVEREAQLEKLQKVRLGNPWQTRSTLAGLIVWTLSAFIPDKKETSEEIERMAVKHDTNIIGYVAERLKQAVWFPDWGEHKRQMIGLGYAMIGICSSLGAWRNSAKPNVEALKMWLHEPNMASKMRLPMGPTYKFNGSYLATSLLSFASSIPLLFAVDDQKGFAGFGSLMAGRLLFLPSSISKKFGGGKGLGEDGAKYYLGATAAFQAENLAQALIGGAEKMPDGAIVDHTEIKEKARLEAMRMKEKRATAHHRNVLGAEKTPGLVISETASVEKAMPERVVEAALAKDTAAVTA